ncbi:MAG: hypothetical protein U0905_13005 [Pirellulales bacterium]
MANPVIWLLRKLCSFIPTVSDEEARSLDHSQSFATPIAPATIKPEVAEEPTQAVASDVDRATASTSRATVVTNRNADVPPSEKPRKRYKKKYLQTVATKEVSSDSVAESDVADISDQRGATSASEGIGFVASRTHSIANENAEETLASATNTESTSNAIFEPLRDLPPLRAIAAPREEKEVEKAIEKPTTSSKPKPQIVPIDRKNMVSTRVHPASIEPQPIKVRSFWNDQDESPVKSAPKKPEAARSGTDAAKQQPAKGARGLGCIVAKTLASRSEGPTSSDANANVPSIHSDGATKEVDAEAVTATDDVISHS